MTTATTITADTLLDAKAQRDAEMGTAQEEYKERCQRANDVFADAVRAAAETTSISKIAQELGMNRQNLHRLLTSGKSGPGPRRAAKR